MEYSKQISKRGRVGGSSGRISAVYFLLGLLLIAGLTSILHHFYFTPATDTDNSSKEYAELLRKAKLLTAKYSELTGGGLSQDLAKVESTHSSTSSTVDTNDILSMKGTKDMIIGMAQDTDPKNFVRLTVFVSKPWCSLAVTANCSMYRLCSASRCGGKRTFKLNYNAPLDTNWGCASVSDADAVIFVNKPIPDRHAQIATELKITLVPFQLDAVQPSFMQKYHPSTLRWPLFHAYFQEHAVTAHYRRVWMIDVRDSYFQSDPFAFISLPAVPSVAPNAARASSTSLHVFSGVESFPIRECGWNSGWIKDCFGPQVLGAVGHRGIICSGVSAGSVEAVAEYVRTMSEIITGSAHSKVAGEFPQCERNGVDQGVHNVLVHTGALDHLNLRSWGQADSPVANMQAKVAVLHCNGDGADERCVVRNRAGVAVAVVHQYDRYPQLQQFLFKKYVDWVKTGDLQAEWDFEPACRAAYEHRAGTDLFKGMCDLPHRGGVTSAAACCALCDERRGQGCQAFTFLAGTCYFKSCGKSGRGGAARSIDGAVSGYLKF